MVQADTVLAFQGSQAAVVYISKEELEHDAWIHPQLDVAIQRLKDNKLFKAEPHEVKVLPTLGLIPYDYLILAGIGGHPYHEDAFRDGAVFAAKEAFKLQIETLTVSLSPLPESNGVQGAATGASTALVMDHGILLRKIAEGITLGSYRMRTYAMLKSEDVRLTQVNILAKQLPAQEISARELLIGNVYGEATNVARDLTNMPGNLLTPQGMAEEAVRIASKHGMFCEVHDEVEIERLGMGGLAAVGKGSANPPRMIVMKYQGADEWTDVLGLVGKGITFDTGGISLKKGEGMEEMISDMGGAATLLGVMDAVGRLKPKVNLITVIPAAENMPAGNAFKPGDVITSMSGRTIEVLNTDAEGRIVLADGMTYARQLGAEKLIDVATLTGAILINFGDVATGAVTNDETFLHELQAASKRAGEKVWPLPSYPEYWDMLKSDVADIKNAQGRWAAAITAGLFIGTFAEGAPWIHLDTGGTAWLWSDKGTEPKGATGSMVRTVLELILT
ncbi:hypothetical protein SY83_08340 [Paenibacillus swuensis]|uniref:Probable cytosol aminopeptidase n=1 Tax=Paenibacillus swuensis TaxID=1178515 RepID=A0A172TNY6_9BACL|nr:hypothetical protein SY83_08340 [Paenibacillus swuensis]